MKWIASILLLVSLIQVSEHNQEQIRLAYRDATESKENAEKFYGMVQNTQKNGTTELVAYKGAAITLLARYEKLLDRADKVKEGVEWIEHAVKSDPDNPEIRLVRLSVQQNLPKLLKYNHNIEEDSELIRKAYPNIQDEGLKKMIQGYFKEFN